TSSAMRDKEVTRLRKLPFDELTEKECRLLLYTLFNSGLKEDVLYTTDLKRWMKLTFEGSTWSLIDDVLEAVLRLYSPNLSECDFRKRQMEGFEKAHLASISIKREGFEDLALGYYFLGDAEQALANSNQAVVLEANSGYAWLGRALALCSLERFEEAIADVFKALALESPETLNYFEFLKTGAIAYYGLGKLHEAESLARQSLARRPSKEAQMYLCLCLLEQGRLNLAVTEFSNLSKNWPEWNAIDNSRYVQLLYRDEFASRLENGVEQLMKLQSEHQEAS
ncbi:MAG: tetratricopeptide repeat protein, partial [Pseudomonadota bacterium]